MPSAELNSAGSPRAINGGDVQPYASEVIGRECALLRSGKCSTSAVWEDAVITGYDEATGKHRVKASKGVEWVCLRAQKFRWTAAPPDNAPPNPTYAASPHGEAAVGRRVRIYWPGASGALLGWCTMTS